MDEEQDWADGDPEIAALLDFEPVRRRNVRHDGWSPAHQRGFIAALARLGSVDRAAEAVDRATSGAWTVRQSAGAGEFADAWDAALELFHRRNPKLSRRGGRARPPWGERRAPDPGPRHGRDDWPREEPTQAEVDAHWQLFCDSILMKYLMKLGQEREARLMGCIVEADFYVRQLCWLEVALDLGGLGDKGVAMLKGLKRGDLHAGQIVATPVSLLLDHLRRSVWAKFGEPERPPPPELGLHAHEDASIGGPSESTMPGLSEAELALRAEANLLWEEKGRKDAAAWRERLGLPPLEDGEGKDEAEEDER
jgi:hypothetical protein